jgi:competence protein ComGC
MMTRRIAIAVVAVLVLLAVPVLAEDKKPMADEFTAVFISMNAPGAMGSPVQIWIENYTTDEVAESLMTTLQTKGQTALVNALPNTRAGTIRIGTSNGYPISIARKRQTADGTVVIMASNRPFVGMTEGGVAGAESPIGFIQLQLKADGTGTGTIIGAAQVSVDANKNLTVASEAVQPGRLSDVKERKPKTK